MERSKKCGKESMFKTQIKYPDKMIKNLAKIMRYGGPDLNRALFSAIGKWVDIIDDIKETYNNFFEEIIRILVISISNIIIPLKSDDIKHEVFISHVKEARNYQIIKLVHKYSTKVLFI